MAIWFKDSVHGQFLKMLLIELCICMKFCYKTGKTVIETWVIKPISISVVVTILKVIESCGDDHHSGCPSKLLTKKTYSVPWCVQIVNGMRNGGRQEYDYNCISQFELKICVCAKFIAWLIMVERKENELNIWTELLQPSQEVKNYEVNYYG